jgi:hypothetical protein
MRFLNFVRTLKCSYVMENYDEKPDVYDPNLIYLYFFE